MLPAAANGDAAKRTAADNQTVRNVFVIGPDKKIKLILVYPMTTGRNFDEVLRVIDSLQLTAKHKVATPVNWRHGEDVIIAGSVSDEDARKRFRTAGRSRGRTCASSRSRAVERGQDLAMSKLSRRRFTSLAGVSLAAATTPLFAPAVLGQAKPRVVVVGGGPGGGTVARYVAKDAAGAIDVTLIEPQREFTTCFFSNVYLGGFRSFESITHDYQKVARHGVRVVHEWASAINRERRHVVLASGARVPYDRLVIAPGIDLKWDSCRATRKLLPSSMPHAWKAGAQTKALTQRLNSLDDGALIVMVAPPNPYRCPPGPYERVSMFAHVLKTKGHTRSKIIVVDAKASFSKQGLFMEGWEKHYPGMVEWQDPKVHGGIRVDPKTNQVVTELATYKAALVNVIPAQVAGRIARDAALADQSGFCPIDPESMRSKLDANIFVVGDACIPGDMPKSAFSANSQAKVAAMTIRADLTKSRAFPARYANTCWSLIAPDDGVMIGGTYEPGDGKIKQVLAFVSRRGEPAALREQNYEELVDWYAGIVGDVFG